MTRGSPGNSVVDGLFFYSELFCTLIWPPSYPVRGTRLDPTPARGDALVSQVSMRSGSFLEFVQIIKPFVSCRTRWAKVFQSPCAVPISVGEGYGIAPEIKGVHMAFRPSSVNSTAMEHNFYVSCLHSKEMSIVSCSRKLCEFISSMPDTLQGIAEQLILPLRAIVINVLPNLTAQLSTNTTKCLISLLVALLPSEIER